LHSLISGTHAYPWAQLKFGVDFDGDGRNDVFRRGPSGEWWAIYPLEGAEELLGGSGFALGALQFGDFDADGITDIVGPAGSTWSVSWGGRSSWDELNPTVGDNLTKLRVGNIDKLPGDDIFRLTASGGKVTLEVSSAGASHWLTVSTVELGSFRQKAAFVGYFDGFAGEDLLLVGQDRTGRIYSKAHSDFGPYGLYWY
jgi:hypothetical protein